MEETFADFLRRERKAQRLTLGELSGISGVAISTISDLEHGRSKTPSSLTRDALLEALKVEKQKKWHTLGTSSLAHKRPSGKVPLISYVIGGDPEFPEDPYSVGDALDWIVCTESHSELTYALYVRGQSMQSDSGISFPEGSIIFCDPQVKARSGSFVIARILDTGYTTFKQLKQDAGTHFLTPLNKAYPIIKEPFECIAVVIELRQAISR